MTTTSEATYLDDLHNCTRFNKRLIRLRKRPYPFFDQQTGIAHRSSKHLVRSQYDRIPDKNPFTVYRYPAERWKNASKISFDSIEYKFILSTDPHLKAAIDHIEKQNEAPSSFHVNNEHSNDSASNTRFSSGGNARTNFENLDFDDFDPEDFDVDGSDEEDWGHRGRKRRRGREPGFKPSNRRSGANSASAAASASAATREANLAAAAASSAGRSTPNLSSAAIDGRPYACTECGARYKSRPGLTYHKVHVHQEGGSNDSPNSPMTIDIAEKCDFCDGTKHENKKTKQPEELVSCHDCGRSAHPSCLKFTPNMIISTKKHGWQCIECKSCAICGTSENDNELLFCDDCDRGFHCSCLRPPLKKPPEDEWSCNLCQKEFGDKASNPKSKST